MAKKRRQKIEKKDDYVFKMPEMDKNEFIRKEIRNAKTTFIAFGFAILMAVVSFGIRLALDDFRVAAIIGLFAVVGLPFLFNFLKIDMTEYEKKSWLGVGAVYIFTWLLVLFIISNPPITDLAEPQIADIQLEAYSYNETLNLTVWEPIREIFNDQPVVHFNQEFQIKARIWDNHKLKEDSIRCELFYINPDSDTKDPGDTIDAKKHDENVYTFEYTFFNTTSSSGMFEYRIYAEDESDNWVEHFGRISLRD